MLVTLIGDVPCPVCGYLNESASFINVRVNKRSIRQTDPGRMQIGVRPRRCEECGCEDLKPDRERVRLSARSQAEVDAYRARRWAP